MDERLVIDADVARREDGIVFSFQCSDGSYEEHYVSQEEARDILDQINRQLHPSASTNEEKI